MLSHFYRNPSHRPQLLPYARVTIRTRLSTEQCQERLAAVVQPQRTVTLFTPPAPNDPSLLLRGRASGKSFLVTRIELRMGRPGWQSSLPMIWGRLRPALGGTDVVMQVLPDPAAVLLGCLGLLFFGYLASWGIMNWDGAGAIERASVIGPMVYLLASYAILAIPVSLEAAKAGKLLTQVFEPR